jgi:signal transduction histidine kinase
VTRSRTTFLLFAGLIGLLILLGLLQYRWQSQISASETEKLHKQIQEETTRFAGDFNREVQNAYFNFQTDAESWKTKNWSDFNARLDYWRSKTQYPELVRDFYYFDAAPDAAPLRYDAGNRVFAPAEWNDDLRNVRSLIGDGTNFRPSLPEIYMLVLPIHEAREKIDRIFIRTPAPQTLHERVPPPMPSPKTAGYLIIKLDDETIRDKIIPDLANKYFGDGECVMTVRDTSGTPVFSTKAIDGEGDARAGMFDLSAENFILFSNRDVLSSIGGEKRSTVIYDTKVESRTIPDTPASPAGAGRVTVQMQRSEPPKTSIIATKTRSGEQPPWTLITQHRDGSVEAYVGNVERRNLGIGFGILALLGASVAAIIVSSQRARTFAQRQVDFVSSVSHEFRTPLAVIYSAGENLADGVAKDTTQVAKYGNLIKGEGKKLSAMVEQILDFAGANSGKRKYNFRETNMADIAMSAVAECRSTLDSEGFKLETDIPESLPAVNADRPALTQAIQNLIANSIKYSNGHKWIRLSAANGGGSVKITVEDRGIGISNSDRKHVFEPFYRSKEVVDAQIHGNGLGLALVKQIAEAHGGHVHAESDPGKGSKFTIELPTAG